MIEQTPLILNHGNIAPNNSVDVAAFRIKQHASERQSAATDILAKELGLGMNMKSYNETPTLVDGNASGLGFDADPAIDLFSTGLTANQQELNLRAAEFNEWQKMKDKQELQLEEMGMLSEKYTTASGSPQASAVNSSHVFQDLTGQLIGNKQYIKSKASRNNNPGNITGAGGKKLFGAVGIAHSKHGDAGDRAQLQFKTMDDGWRAMNSLMSSKNYNNAPISQAFSKWQSDQGAWGRIKNSYRKVGIDVDNQRYNDLSSSQKLDFMRIRALHEGFYGQAPSSKIFG